MARSRFPRIIGPQRSGFRMKVGISLAVVTVVLVAGTVAAYHSSPPIEFDESRPTESVSLRPMYIEDTTAQFTWSKPESSNFATRYHLELTGFLPDVDYAPVMMNEGLHNRGSRQMRFGKLDADTTYMVCLSTGIPLVEPFGKPECVAFLTDPLNPDARQPE